VRLRRAQRTVVKEVLRIAQEGPRTEA